MVNYSGSFSGILVRNRDPEIDYDANQTILVKVQQDDLVLASRLIDQIDSVGKLFEIEFYYNNLISPIQLIFESCLPDDQFNRDNPVIVNKLLIDDLFSTPGVIYTGKLLADRQILDTGNVLWKSGQLVYSFILPMLRNFNNLRTR